MQPKYKRVLLKLSGEALAGDQRFGLNHEVIEPVVKQIVEIHKMRKPQTPTKTIIVGMTE